jgi:ubiquinone/menaquinone biosynthesis C-methylase UbiE
MSTTAEEIREIADALAPTWERRRAEVEAVTAPVREWMLLKLAARPGDTVLELAAGVGDTGFDAATIVASGAG